jgi:hypothetical protein
MPALSLQHADRPFCGRAEGYMLETRARLLADWCMKLGRQTLTCLHA